MYVASLTVIGEGERETRRDETPSPQIHIGAVDLKHRFNVLFRIPWTYHLFSSVPCMSSSVNLFKIELFLRYNNSALDIFALSLVSSLPPAPRPVVSRTGFNCWVILGSVSEQPGTKPQPLRNFKPPLVIYYFIWTAIHMETQCAPINISLFDSDIRSAYSIELNARFWRKFSPGRTGRSTPTGSRCSTSWQTRR